MASFFKIKTKPEKEQKKQRERNSNSMRRHKGALARHARRGSMLGRLNEARVSRLLEKKQGEGQLLSFEAARPGSFEDSQGRDFRVSIIANGKPTTAFFGVTISARCYEEHRLKHPYIPAIIIPPEMSDERIWQRICQILKDKQKEASS